MLSIKIKDIKNRQKFHKKELSKIQIRFLFKNLLSNLLVKKDYKRYSAFLYSFLKLSSKSSKTKIRRRCVLNNRSRVSNRKFAVSRIVFREFLQFGIIPGFTKAVW
jgi:ribosomal protein S14|tara:strand:+ start:32 stop:349 length:318 start_codon:yes stop_codon:yes gene_type:complete